MNTWGHELKLSIFGESHGKAIGIIVDGLPPGEAVSTELIELEMKRRAPGQNEFSTARREADKVEILSGIHNGKTTGSPISGVIFNNDTRSRDYDAALRPGHADWTALLKYGGHADMRGGGHFSGRLTAPLVFAGSLAKQVLERRGITIYGRISEIGGVRDTDAPHEIPEYQKVSGDAFPVFDSEAGERMKSLILTAKADGDSVGGIVEAVAFGLPGGLGEPFFGSVESAVASLLFSIPAVKGVEFGVGFSISAMRGSEANDGLIIDGGRISSDKNSNGGALGGITNGMPLAVRAAFKPTPSIAKTQRSVDASAMKEIELNIKGRHDPCIVPRAIPVVEACVALAVLDLLLSSRACGAF